MCFSPNCRTLRIDKTDGQILLPKMSVNTESNTDTSESRHTWKIDKTTNGFSPEFIEGRIITKIEPLNTQTSTLTQLLI